MHFFRYKNQPTAASYVGVATVLEPDGSREIKVSDGSSWTSKITSYDNGNTWSTTAWGTLTYSTPNGVVLSTSTYNYPVNEGGAITAITVDIAATTGGTVHPGGNIVGGTLGTKYASTNGAVGVVVERVPVSTSINPSPTPVLLAGSGATHPISFAQSATTQVVVSTPGSLVEGDTVRISVYTGTHQVETLAPTGTAADGTIIVDGISVTLAATDDTATKVCTKIIDALVSHTDKYYSVTGTSTVVVTFRVPGPRTAITTSTGAGVTVTSVITTPGVIASATGTQGLTVAIS